MDVSEYESSREVDGWDKLVLGREYARYESLLRGERIAERITMALRPLQQAMLLNAATTGGTMEALRAAIGDPTDNPILSSSQARPLSKPEEDEDAEQGDIDAVSADVAMPKSFAWRDARAVLTPSLSATFLVRIASLTRDVGEGIHRFEPNREWLGSLLFQPLQNAVVHGGLSPRASSCAGIAVRRVATIEPTLDSATEYEEYLSAYSGGGLDGFLEFTIHDNGQGVAAHFYDSKRGQSDPDLQALPIFSEWVLLNQAFERHQTGRPRDFVRQTTDPHARPGVGLAGLLSAVHRLGAYFELRSNRLRAYRWYRHDEVIPRDVMLLPRKLMRPAEHVCGTIIRIFVPMFLDRTQA